MVRARHLLRSSLLVILFFGLNKVTGFVRLLLVGNVFGTSPDADAFTAANQLPELFFVLVAGGALAAALIPVYSEYLTSDRRQEAAALAHTVMTLVFVVLGSICLATAALAPWLMRVVLVPDFAPEQQLLAAELMRIILLNTILFGISGVLSSLLNAHQHFALPALAPVALDIGYMVGLFGLVPSLGVHGLAWGTVIGALLHIGVQVPALVRYRIGFRPNLALHLSGVREIIRLMGPRIVMLGAIQAADLVIIRLASQFPSGSVSAYFYAFTLMQLPETLFGTAIAIVLFPTLAELYNAGDLDGLKQLAVRGLRIIWALTVPAAFAIVLLGEPAIALVLQRGAFDATSTALVYSVLVFFSVRVVAEATLEIVARLFYARHNTFKPMVAYLGWLVVNVAGNALLVSRLGLGGLALASTIAFTLLALVLLLWNRVELGGLPDRSLGVGFGRNLLAAVGMSAVILALRALNLAPLLFLAVGGVLGVVTYGALLWLLGGSELNDLLRLVRRRLPAE